MGDIDYNETWFRLSESQRMRWFSYHLEPDSQGAHNCVNAIRVACEIDVEQINRALQSTIACHPMLNARFRSSYAEPEQMTVRNDDLTASCVDASDFDEEMLRLRITKDSLQSFDLGQNPLIRLGLYQISANEAVILLVSDRITVDDWSHRQILIELVSRLFDDGDGVTLNSESGATGSSYESYVEWQQDWLTSPDGLSQLHYWKQRLAGKLPLLHIPHDVTRSVPLVNARRQFALPISASLTLKLHDVLPRYSCTLSDFLITAYGILLHRYSAQDDIIIGTPVNTRLDSQWSHVVGDFQNHIAVRIVFGDSPKISEVLCNVRDTITEAMENKEYPFSLLVENLQCTRSAGTHPVFQTTFALRSAGIVTHLNQAKRDWSGFDDYPIDHGRNNTNIGLALESVEAADAIDCVFHYDPAIYDTPTIERLAAHYISLISDMVADPCQTIREPQLIGPVERRTILGEFNATGPLFTGDYYLHELFEKHAASQPEAIAVVYEDSELNYAELNVRANRLAHRLIALGVKPEDRVVLCMERCVGLIVGLLGILKSGAAYVPFDPSYPADRMAFMLEDCTPVAVVTQNSEPGFLPSIKVPALLLSTDGDSCTGSGTEEVSLLTQSRTDTNPDPSALGLKTHHLAYAIYTSGSTGKPKGVMIEHGNVPHIYGAAQPWFQLEESETWSMFHSSAFDFSVWEIWGALLHGGKLVIVPIDCARSPDEFYSLLCRENVTVVSQTPSAFRQVISAQLNSQESHSLRKIFFAGEPLELTSVSRWFELNDPDATQLINMYGATESTVHATYKLVTPADVKANFRGICGKPIPGYAIYILDSLQQPVPLGVAGEIYIGGPCVARGYMNREELTAERFTSDHFTNNGDSRLYKTGDVGRWLEDGVFDYLGRNDFQVKIRGFRVELGEIEVKLSSCEGVSEVVVIAREDKVDDKRLVAYIVPANAAIISVAALRGQLSRILPDYMVPSAFVIISEIPLTANQKLDRNSLPIPDSTAVVSQVYIAPRGEVEKEIAEFWQSILGIERVGRNDSYFDLGGQSLLALKVLYRIRETFAVNVPLRALFERPQLADLAEFITQERISLYQETDIEDLQKEVDMLSVEELQAILNDSQVVGDL